MFNVGGGEFIVIMFIALIVLGPQRLPHAARQIGKVMGDLRRLSEGFQKEVKSTLAEVDDLTRLTDRRNVLGTDAAIASPPTPSNTSAEAAIAAVSEAPVAPTDPVDPPVASE